MQSDGGHATSVRRSAVIDIEERSQMAIPRSGSPNAALAYWVGGQVRISGPDVCDSAMVVGSGWARPGLDDVLVISDDMG